MMKVYKKAILPAGFKANGISCGIKKSGKLDLALIYSQLSAIASVKATTNKIPAAPIKLNQRYLKNNREFRAIIANSGSANAFTGKTALTDALRMTQAAAKALGVSKEKVLVASTGIIGKRLPIEKIEKAMPSLVNGLSGAGINRAKQAIITTDKFVKEISVRFNLGRHTATLCAIAKGAGMIAPDMATMLVFILTDAAITKRALDKALKIAVDNSFNCITVDSCMSTNDTVILLANGALKNPAVDLNRNFNLFLRALNLACLELAKMIVRDGEGATKFITLKVSGAGTEAEAKKVALSIANSALFKTAMYASSPNVLGRIVASAGSAGVQIKERDLKIRFSPLHKKEVEVRVSLGKGRQEAVIYTSDLTHEYVKINAEYN